MPPILHLIFASNVDFSNSLKTILFHKNAKQNRWRFWKKNVLYLDNTVGTYLWCGVNNKILCQEHIILKYVIGK